MSEISLKKDTEVSFSVNAQYIKDLSFENPKGFLAFIKQENVPDISINLQVKARNVQDEVYEVVLEQKCHAQHLEKETLFLIELHYAGLFTISQAQENVLNAILFIECPRFLFPFARSIICDITRDSGFPPLMLSPVNFEALYARQQQGTMH